MYHSPGYLSKNLETILHFSSSCFLSLIYLYLAFIPNSESELLKLLEFPELQCLLSFTRSLWEQREVYANEVIQGESLVSEGLVTLGGVDLSAPPSEVKGGERGWK